MENRKYISTKILDAAVKPVREKLESGQIELPEECIDVDIRISINKEGNVVGWITQTNEIKFIGTE